MNEPKLRHAELALSQKYRENNWLLDAVPKIKAMGGKKLIELGCGNGLFLKAISPYFETVVGVDFIKAPDLNNNIAETNNVFFYEADITDLMVARFDVCVSADVLEHMLPSQIEAVMALIDRSGKRGYHKVACYHAPGHYSVRPVHEWSVMFHKIGYRLYDTSERGASRIVATFTR